MKYRESDFDPIGELTRGKDDDPRIGRYISVSPGVADEIRIAIAGFPVDDGVRINGGRVGAAHAPDEIRAVLYAMTPDARRYEEHEHVLRQTADVGNLRAGRTLAEKQEALGRFVADCLEAAVVPLILGGGHETAYGHFLGYPNSKKVTNIVNVDAHPDVRPLIGDTGHSGSPFRQALEHPLAACASYTVAGLQPGRVASAHWDFLTEHGARGLWIDETTPASLAGTLVPAVGTGGIMLTLDVDAVDQSFAPGVSAPAVGGLHQDVILDMAYAAGATPEVTSIDVVEVNPLVDEGGRTVRLAAHLVWKFLLGFAERV